MFENMTILITGGTGSFGKTVLDRVLNRNVKEVRIFSRDEEKQDALRKKYNDPKLKCIIGDVRDRASIDEASLGVDYVFHAAALKQVPSCEFFPLEALKTNVIGTENVLGAGIRANVKKVVLLSTDKAVYPINAMGISKAMAEKVLVAKSRNNFECDTIFCATRYGNVMASRGSVIPLFVSQIKSGSNLTITDPLMTRFLMSLEESVDLVFHAFEKGERGDIFVQKSSAATIMDLALALKKIFQAENEITVIGTRHGEKLYETLVSREEMLIAEDMGKFLRVPSDKRDLNYDKYFIEGATDLAEVKDYTSHNTHRLSVDEICDLLSDLDFIKEQLNA